MTTLRKGSRKTEAVVMLQELLDLTGHPIRVDGEFGPDTDRAVREYQKGSSTSSWPRSRR